MQRFGVDSLGTDAGRYGLALTLGGGDITLLELTQAYGVFANEGARVPLQSIRCVLDSNDDVLYQLGEGCPHGRQTGLSIIQRPLGEQVLDPRIAFLISDILADNEARSPSMGASSPLLVPGRHQRRKDRHHRRRPRQLDRRLHAQRGRGRLGRQQRRPADGGLFRPDRRRAHLERRDERHLPRPRGMLASFARDGQLLNDTLQPPGGLQRASLCRLSALVDPATACSRRSEEWVLTSPAGIPAQDSGLYYPQPTPLTLAAQASSDVALDEIEPGVFRVLAWRIPSEVSGAIRFQEPDSNIPPPPPLYCQVPQALAAAAVALGAREQLFIAPPASAFPQEAIEAELFARSRNLAFLPTIQCNAALLQPVQQYDPAIATAVITSPQNGSVLTRTTPILGSVIFTPEQAQFYKLELIGGDFSEWVTLGSTHSNSVPNGQLETLYVPSLAPGWYHLRLVLITPTGDLLQRPFEISFSVA